MSIINKMIQKCHKFAEFGDYAFKPYAKSKDFKEILHTPHERKRTFVLLALPRGIARAALRWPSVTAAAVIDNVAKTVEFSKESHWAKRYKVRKWAFLPVRLAFLGVSTVGFALAVPVAGVAYAVKAVANYKYNRVEQT